jgi:hypothetical protein
MKTAFRVIVLFTLVFQPGLGALPSTAAQGNQPVELVSPQTQAANDLPGWPMPDKPVPHHEPGHLSDAINYTSQVEVVDAMGAVETVPLSGLDAMAADGIDPLAGNYTLVGLDKVMRSAFPFGALVYNVETFSVVTNTIDLMPGSHRDFGNYPSNDIAAGDLNGDGIAEQIVAYLDSDLSVNFSIGDLPGSNGKTTSAPAAVVGDGVVHLLVRGYDQALWHCTYDVGSSSCTHWDNDTGGGLLLSAPAVVAKAAGAFDVYAILSDYRVHRRSWSAAGWSAAWEQVDNDTFTETLSVPAPELAAPAVVVRESQVDLFRLGKYNTLQWRHSDDGSTWGAWQDLGGILTSGPAALKVGASDMQVFARGLDDSLWTRRFNGPSESWGNWRRVPQTGMAEGVTIASTPAAISRGAGDIIVYVRGSDNQLWMVSNEGSGWSEWSEGGGNLASAPAGILAGGIPYLFAQTRSGGLQVYHEPDGWNQLPGGLPPCCTNTDTGLTGKQKWLTDGSIIYKDYSVDIESGYFWGDRRSQIALGYFSGDNQVQIALVDLSDSPGAQGFTPEIVTQFTLEHPVSYMRIATGNFIDISEENDIGLDDIAVAYVHGFDYGVDLLHFNRQTRTLEAIPGANYKETSIYLSGGTLEAVSGDFDGDALDEITVSTSWYNYTGDVNQYSFTMHVYDAVKTGTGYGFKRYYDQTSLLDADLLASAASISGDLAAGDVDGDGVDEIVRIWAIGFDDKDSTKFGREVQVINLDTTPWGDEGGIPCQNGGEECRINIGGYVNALSYGDRLAVGDFDLDMKGEILWQFGLEGPSQMLYVFDHRNTGTPTTPKYEYVLAASKGLAWGWLPNLVTGDFTGESVRVGPPTYRMQNRVDTMISLINVPPSHRDLVKDASGNYHLIASPSDPCQASAGTPDCTHAKYATKTFQSSQQTIQTQHAYSVSAGMESKNCGGVGVAGVATLKTCVTTSINYTHGGNFEKTTKEIASTTFSRSVIATDDDKLVYFGTPYGVWEYPILNSPTGEAGGYITVAFPLVTTTKDPNDADGYLACNEDWYAAGHQVNNIWSYDPIGPLTFEDYDDNYAPIYNAGMSAGSALEIAYDAEKEEIESNTFKHKISAGYTYEAKAEAKIKIVDLDGNIKANVNGDYEYTSMNTDVIKRETGTTFSLFLGAQPATSKFYTQAVFYWAKSGYQVLNYQADPGAGGDWQYYTGIADPAFILPWYGFPEDPDPARNTYETPPCGSNKRQFSPDVQAYPAIAGVGKTVEISATVRNFSNYAPTKPVVVRFYLGDPSQNVVIGQDTLVALNRQTGPKIAHITWTASGSGRQKIYAVIDPDKAIPEVHDEDDLINNNVAYTPIEIGSAAFADMGVVEEKPYQGQIYSQGADIQAAFYMPSANLGAVTRFDLKDLQERIGNAIGKAFELVAYDGSGGNEWDEPNTEFEITPKAGDLPATITVEYSNGILAGKNEADLRLYQETPSGWKPAEEQCKPPGGQPYEVQRFPEENMIAVPVCQTGTFVLAAGAPSVALYLPIVTRQ